MPFSSTKCSNLGKTLRLSLSRYTQPSKQGGLGLGGNMVLQYTSVFRHPNGIVFSTIKSTDAHLFIKFRCRVRIEDLFHVVHRMRHQRSVFTSETNVSGGDDVPGL